MNNTAAMAKGLSEVATLLEAEKYDRAIKKVEELRKSWPGNPHLSVLWSRIVQLQEDPAHTLNDVKRALQQAVELDKQSPEAAVELGFFLDNVEDDPRSASKAFAQGISAARRLLIEGLLGQAHARFQLNDQKEGLRCLLEARHLAEVEKPLKDRYLDRIGEILREQGPVQTV